MTDADNLALLGRVMGGLVVVLVLIGLAARVARRARGHKGTSGLRVIDRIGLSREANLTVVEVGDRVLLLGVTAQGVTMLADLKAAAERETDYAVAPPEAVPVHRLFDGSDDATDRGPARRSVRTGRPHTLATPDHEGTQGQAPAATAASSQRRPVPTGVALDEYPDLASALRAAGRTAESSSTARPSRPAAAIQVPAPAGPPASAALPSAPSATGSTTPRTRAEARAEARARAAVAAQEAAASESLSAPAWVPEAVTQTAPTGSTSSEIDRIPAPRNGSSPTRPQRATARPAGPASGSVLSPRTWRQGLDALRDLTVRRG